MGDWIDAEGQLHGNQPFQTFSVKDKDKKQHLEIDITSLVKKWLDKPALNNGLLLTNLTTGNGTTVFHSREAGDFVTPVIELALTNGTKSLAPATADTVIHKSSLGAYGHKAQLKVGRDNHSLIYFPITDITSDKVQQATLFLTTTTTQYGDNQLGIYQVYAHSSAEINVEQGLAQNFSLDLGIESAPGVLYSQSFDSPSWHKQWSDFRGLKNTLITKSQPDQKFQPLIGNALRIRFTPKQNTAASFSLMTRDLLGYEPEELYFRYYLRLGSNWNSDRGGGKFPGFSGTYNRAGWGGRPATGSDGWSARGLFANTVDDGLFQGQTPIGSYLYHLDFDNRYGEKRLWGKMDSLLEKNRWYAIEQYIRLNTPSLPNGQLTVWIDGRKIVDYQKMRFRTTNTLKIEKVWFDFYHGGLDKPSSIQDLYIDNIVVAESYIGPINP